MGKAEKLFNKWSGNIPTDARVQEVKTLLNHYFKVCGISGKLLIS